MRRASRTDAPKRPTFSRGGGRQHFCPTCKVEFRTYSKTSKYCSLSCRSRSPHEIERIKSYLPLGRAAWDAKLAAAGPKMCEQCGAKERSKTGSFCADCGLQNRRGAIARQKQKWLDWRAQLPAPEPNHTCRTCAKPFFSKEVYRKYCSQDCHWEKRGDHYVPMKDSNHDEVFNVLRAKCPMVYDLSSQGGGMPDGCAAVGREWVLFEVKNPLTKYGRKGLNKNQQRFAAEWKGAPMFILHSAEEAERFAAANFDGLKKFA
jgi:hypothetical protein